MQTLVLRIRNAGLGDVIFQLNVFFNYCEAKNLIPQILIPNKSDRNELMLKDFLGICNLNDFIFKEVGVFNHEFAPFSQLVSDNIQLNKKDSQFFFDFDLESYATVVKHISLKRPHPYLIYLVKASELYSKVKHARKALRSPKFCVHVRRGDVALIKARTIQHLLKDNVDPNLILTVFGIFKPEEIKTQIKQNFLSRFASIYDYLHAFEEQICNLNDNVEVVVVSDGMTKLAKKLKNQYSDKFKDIDISRAEIETGLELELNPLISKSNNAFIGEENTLINTIVESMTSDIIISKSPGFLLQLARMFEINIRFVQIKNSQKTLDWKYSKF